MTCPSGRLRPHPPGGGLARAPRIHPSIISCAGDPHDACSRGRLGLQGATGRGTRWGSRGRVVLQGVYGGFYSGWARAGDSVLVARACRASARAGASVLMGGARSRRGREATRERGGRRRPRPRPRRRRPPPLARAPRPYSPAVRPRRGPGPDPRRIRPGALPEARAAESRVMATRNLGE